jgi:hypothetical protein
LFSLYTVFVLVYQLLFFSFLKKRVFVFDETHNATTMEVLEYLNQQAKEERRQDMFDQQIASPPSPSSPVRGEVRQKYQGPFLQIMRHGVGQFVFDFPSFNIGYDVVITIVVVKVNPSLYIH